MKAIPPAASDSSSDPAQLLKASDFAAVLQLTELIRLCARQPSAWRGVTPSLREAAARIKPKYVERLMRVSAKMPRTTPASATRIAIPRHDVYYKLEALAAGRASDSADGRGASPALLALVAVLGPAIHQTMEERLHILQQRPSLAQLEEWLGRVADLSPRELEAARLYLAGGTKREIAETMRVEFETVKTFIRRLHDKAGVNGREELIGKLQELAQPHL
jgi:DNA-binding CsgD family transcriptional regulator